MKDTILSFLRHLLTFGGGFISAKGYVSDSGIETCAAAAVAFAGALWGCIDEYRASKKTQDSTAQAGI